METFSGSVELIRLTFLFGALAAVAYKKLSGVTPGGIIVPAFLAIILDDNFLWFVILLGISALTVAIYRLILANIALAHRWMVLINIAIASGLTFLVQYLLRNNLSYSEISSYGFIVPGLIASAAQTKPPKDVAKGVLTVTAITYIFGALLFKLLPYSVTSQLNVQLANFDPIITNLELVAIPLSLLMAGLSYWLFKARSGGYIIAPIISAIFAGSIEQFMIFLGSTVLVFGLMKVVLEKSLVVGLDRFVLILFVCTALVTITDKWAIASNMPGYLTSPLMLILAMAVWVNDLCLQPVHKSTKGFSLPIFASSMLTRVVR